MHGQQNIKNIGGRVYKLIAVILILCIVSSWRWSRVWPKHV